MLFKTIFLQLLLFLVSVVAGVIASVVGVSSLVYTQGQISELAHNQGETQIILQDHEARLTIAEHSLEALNTTTGHLAGILKDTREDLVINLALDRFESALNSVFDDVDT